MLSCCWPATADRRAVDPCGLQRREGLWRSFPQRELRCVGVNGIAHVCISAACVRWCLAATPTGPLILHLTTVVSQSRRLHVL